jgi:Cu2+-containing amine oxidase
MDVPKPLGSSFCAVQVTLRKAICMHEEDYGLLWKHLDYRSGHVESRRSRRLVISFMCVSHQSDSQRHTCP